MINWWTQKIELDTPAGQTLRKLVEVLPKTRPLRITLFGSAPLQLSIDATLLSGDVDIFSDEEFLAEVVERAGLSEKQHKPGFQVCSELNFRTSPRWKDRVRTAQIENVTFIIPHPYDILIAKLNRLEEKDLLAFRTVLAKTGHPTEAELIHELQMAVDLFRPSFDEEQGHDIANNCRRLWPLIYGREIDPRKEIIAPALKIRREGYGEPTRDYKQELRDALREERLKS
ncbi:MAG TPA: DUF6036 family nucleotidyltransferase [Verrucomicrobiae bacterium]|nr:DUF6036 family nucleotidyltransferase [Verrucomicrobiae bacterium]